MRKVTRTVEIEVWDCGNPNHAHRLEDAAQRCHGRKHYVNPGAALRDRNERIFAARLSGKSHEALAKDFDLSAPRIRQILAKQLHFVARSRGFTPYTEPHYREENRIWVEELHYAKPFWSDESIAWMTRRER